MWKTTLGESWRQRTIWASFASATRAEQIWEAWNWTWLLMVPLACASVAMVIAMVRNRKTTILAIVITTVMLSVIAILATSSYWILSRIEWAPIWHRRYFVAVLPILACVPGGAVASLELALASSKRGVVVGALAALALLILPAEPRTAIWRLRTYPVALVTRGEDWRAAVGWVRARAGDNDLIFLDAGLIEARAWLPVGTPQLRVTDPPSRHTPRAQRTYLTYPVRGPYPLDHVLPARAFLPGLPAPFRSNHPQRRIYWITRLPPDRVNLMLPFGSRIIGFGNVTVVQGSSLADRSF
jgi:hypothetical protein